MKKEYTRPIMRAERFFADEYVAACGDTNDEYIFKCDAMGGITGTVFYSDGDDTFEPFIGDSYMGTGYHACSEEHVTQTGDEFIEGWYVTGSEALSGGGIAKKVIIWRGSDGSNIHCTTTLNKNSWETAKS